jgi:hypothetical protein
LHILREELLQEGRSQGEQLLYVIISTTLLTNVFLLIQRHRLVKGCGEKSGSGDSKIGGDGSPPDRSEIMSDSTEGSPGMIKKE